jgi:hypothetical protein
VHACIFRAPVVELRHVCSMYYVLCTSVSNSGGGYLEHLQKMEVHSLFCSYEIHGTGMLQIVFLVSLESSR